jgi:hypothetical protein
MAQRPKSAIFYTLKADCGHIYVASAVWLKVSDLDASMIGEEVHAYVCGCLLDFFHPLAAARPQDQELPYQPAKETLYLRNVTCFIPKQHYSSRCPVNDPRAVPCKSGTR